MKKTILIALAIFLVYLASAQDYQREVGLSTSSDLNFQAIYKKQRSENKFLRWDFGQVSSSFYKNQNSEEFNFSLGLSMTWEKRKMMGERTFLLHGVITSVSYSFESLDDSINDSRNTNSLGMGIGYLLGVAYQFSDQFYLAAELSPMLRGSFLFLEDLDPRYTLNLRGQSSLVRIVLVHQF